MKIGYLGPIGTFTEQAARKLIGQENECETLIPKESIETLLLDLQRGNIDAAVAPLENSLRGEYKETIKGVQAYNFQIVTSLILDIHLTMGIHPQTKKDAIKEIWSKDSALEQCSNYLGKNFQHAPRKEVQSTAYAMEMIMNKSLRNVAAIGSEYGMNFYGLTIIDKKIENEGSITKFVYIVKTTNSINPSHLPLL